MTWRAGWGWSPSGRGFVDGQPTTMVETERGNATVSTAAVNPAAGNPAAGDAAGNPTAGVQAPIASDEDAEKANFVKELQRATTALGALVRTMTAMS
jgi:hypothetical protein